MTLLPQVIRPLSSQDCTKLGYVLRHAVNLGGAAALNTAFRACDTPLALLLDGDDFLAPTYLEKTLPILTANPDIDAVYTNYHLHKLSIDWRSGGLLAVSHATHNSVK